MFGSTTGSWRAIGGRSFSLSGSVINFCLISQDVAIHVILQQLLDQVPTLRVKVGERRIAIKRSWKMEKYV
jgi:hypothetical protein